MALGSGQLTFTNVSYFIPALWADELAVRYKKNLVLANLVDNLDHTGKYGDVIHIPTSTRQSASAYYSTPGQAITFQAPTTNEMQISINQWWVNGIQVPDLVEKQSLPSMRRFLVNDLAYSLALAVDNYLHNSVVATFAGGAAIASNAKASGGSVIGGDGVTTWDPAANTNTGNGTDLTDDGIRRCMQALDDLDVPGDNRFWCVPPITKRKLLGIPRFTEQAFVGEGGGDSSIRNGYVGNLYGTPVYVSSNCASFDATDAATAYRQIVYAHQSAAILVTQIKPRVQAQYKVEYLSDAIVADVAFGAGVTRTENSSALDRGLSVIVPAS